nr:glycosyltransferase [Lachnospiraceae bacterium]
MEITAVVVTYNRLELLKENIEALRHQSVPDLSILVVNNASTDGTKEYLDEVANNQIGVLHLEENMGGAGGFYYGMKKAYKEG